MVLRVLLLLPLLVACAGPPTDPAPAAVAPPTRTPLPAPTPAPLSVDTLAPLLLQDGDLPQGYSPGERLDQPVPMLLEVVRPDLVVLQRISTEGTNAGYAQVNVYGSEADAQLAYDQMATILAGHEGSGTQAVSDLGDGSITGVGMLPEVAFRRCHAVAYVLLGELPNIADLVNYARRLDARLAAVACLP